MYYVPADRCALKHTRCFGAVSIYVLLTLGVLGRASATDPPKQSDNEHLVTLEKRTRSVVEKVMPAVVFIRGQKTSDLKSQPSAGSGVIISEEGLIASQYHVSHRFNPMDQCGALPVGSKVDIIFSNGTEAEAELLGADVFHDLSLLRLTKPGKYPFVKPEGPDPQVGDSVIKLGHPRGYRPGRTPPVRLGKVIATWSSLFATDCACEGGDSGGPFFDLEGRLIGIIRSTQVPSRALAESGASRARAVLPLSVTSCSVLRDELQALKNGKIVGRVSEEPDLPARFDPNSATVQVLPSRRWSQGEETRAPYESMIRPFRSSVVSLFHDEKIVALGTVVEEGLLLTKASQLRGLPICRLPDGKKVPTELVGYESAFDLALLRVEATGLKAVEWSSSHLPIGSQLAAVGTEDLPIVTGIVSVARRDLKQSVPAPGLMVFPGPAFLPEFVGSAVEGRGYWIEFVQGAAQEAGIRSGDVILTMGETSIRNHADLARAIAGRFAGDQLPIALLRDGKRVELTLPLKGQRDFRSLRLDGFPTVFEHDMPILPEECGGPIVGLDGKVAGIMIARIDQYGGMAIPADCILKLLRELKAGRPAAKLPAIATLPKLSGKPLMPLQMGSLPTAKPRRVTESLEEIRTRLAERSQNFQSLLIEYDTASESLFDPVLLASWGINQERDNKEKNKFAFSGEKRMWETTHAAVTPRAVPPELVEAAPDAPPEVIERIQIDKKLAEANRIATGSHFPFLSFSFGPDNKRSIFDGKSAYIKSNMLPGKPEMRVDPSLFISDPIYLMGLGLRPTDPFRQESVRKAQEGMQLPNNFACYKNVKIRPQTELVDGAACVVIEADVSASQSNKAKNRKDILWLDPALGYSPRKWESWDDSVLITRRSNSNFEEFAPACWLPRKATLEYGPPNWVSSEYWDRPAYRQVMTLQKAVVNKQIDEEFKP